MAACIPSCVLNLNLVHLLYVVLLFVYLYFRSMSNRKGVKLNHESIEAEGLPRWESTPQGGGSESRAKRGSVRGQKGPVAWRGHSRKAAKGVKNRLPLACPGKALQDSTRAGREL